MAIKKVTNTVSNTDTKQSRVLDKISSSLEKIVSHIDKRDKPISRAKDSPYYKDRKFYQESIYKDSLRETSWKDIESLDQLKKKLDII